MHLTEGHVILLRYVENFSYDVEVLKGVQTKCVLQDQKCSQ